MQAFIEENGYSPEHYNDFYKGKRLWESELTGWISAKGWPCLAWAEPRTITNGSANSPDLLPQGLEMDKHTAITFAMIWL